MASVTSLGLGKTMEKKLHSVGIHSAEELTNIGSKEAVLRLCCQNLQRKKIRKSKLKCALTRILMKTG